MEDIKITKMIGGGDSWFYLIAKNRVCAASHEDDKDGMQRLRDMKRELQQELQQKGNQK
jgi:hypothetical protein